MTRTAVRSQAAQLSHTIHHAAPGLSPQLVEQIAAALVADAANTAAAPLPTVPDCAARLLLLLELLSEGLGSPQEAQPRVPGLLQLAAYHAEEVLHALDGLGHIGSSRLERFAVAGSTADVRLRQVAVVVRLAAATPWQLGLLEHCDQLGWVLYAAHDLHRATVAALQAQPAQEMAA